MSGCKTCLKLQVVIIQGDETMGFKSLFVGRVKDIDIKAHHHEEYDDGDAHTQPVMQAHGSPVGMKIFFEAIHDRPPRHPV